MILHRQVHLRIETLPILKGMHKLAESMGHPHSKLLTGTAPETSGMVGYWGSFYKFVSSRK